MEANKKRVFPETKENPKEKCPQCNKPIKYESSKYCTNCGCKLTISNQAQ